MPKNPHLVKELRYRGSYGQTHEQSLMVQAADEIERLQKELARVNAPKMRGW